MASTLSHSAIHRIIFLVEYDDHLVRTRAGRVVKSTRQGLTPRNIKHNLRQLNSTWNAVYKLYADIKPAPPLDYFGSLELTLVLKGAVDNEDVRAIFAHGKPLEFWGCPRLIVSKIVEAFIELQTEPTYLDVTITSLAGFGATRVSEAWPEVYKAHLPCHACSTVETVEERSIPRPRNSGFELYADTVDVAVEKFHVSSKSFGKQLTVELHYRLVEPERHYRLEEPRREQSYFVHKIALRLANETCSAHGRLSCTATRSSATALRLPEFALEGSGLVWSKGAYWLNISHFHRDLSYTDVRRFKVPSTAGADNDCALIRHYLSNSYMADMRAPTTDGFPFVIKMLASLAARNFSVGRVELSAGTKRLSDYRSMDVIFDGLRMNNLSLRCDERRFVKFVKTTDFFRLSKVQSLRELKLTLTEPYDAILCSARSKSPLWVSGVYLLRNCVYYRVDYRFENCEFYLVDYHRLERHLRSIGRKMVQICEKFERGEITDTVEHFQFRTTSSKDMNYPFNRDNMLVSGMKVAGEPHWDMTNFFKWDVYRFRNASTGEYLTACVGQHRSVHVLHIVKGEVYPDASFAKC